MVPDTIAPRVKVLPPLAEIACESSNPQGMWKSENVEAHICRILDLLCPVVARRLAEMYKGRTQRWVSWFTKLYQLPIRFSKLTMSEQANTLSVDLDSLFAAETRLSAGSHVHHLESNGNSAELDTSYEPAMEDFSFEWGKQVLRQQQCYRPDQPHRQQGQQQHTQPQYVPDWPSPQVPDHQVACMFGSSPPVSMAWVPGIQPTSPYDTDWYLPQTSHHNPFMSIDDSERRCVASLPDSARSLPTEPRSTPTQQSEIDVAEQR
jgi:hypothetical protein